MKKLFLISIALLFALTTKAQLRIPLGKNKIEVLGKLQSSVKIIPEILEAGDTRIKIDYYVAFQEKCTITEVAFRKYDDVQITKYYFNAGVTKPKANLSVYKSKIFPKGLAYIVVLSCKIDCFYQDSFDAYSPEETSRTAGNVELLFANKIQAQAFVKQFDQIGRAHV